MTWPSESLNSPWVTIVILNCSSKSIMSKKRDFGGVLEDHSWRVRLWRYFVLGYLFSEKHWQMSLSYIQLILLSTAWNQAPQAALQVVFLATGARLASFLLSLTWSLTCPCLLPWDHNNTFYFSPRLLRTWYPNLKLWRIEDCFSVSCGVTPWASVQMRPLWFFEGWWLGRRSLMGL